jgi:calcium/calmodulin-dependent protein kinase I
LSTPITLLYSRPSRDAADLIRTIFNAVTYIHDADIVHRGKFYLFLLETRPFTVSPCPDLKPENLLFRTPAEDADIMIADFGLSRLMDSDKLKVLTEVCGTPGVRSPLFPTTRPY